MILPRPITFSLGASFAGWLVERLGGRPLVVFGTTGIAIGLLMIGFGAAQDELWMVGVGVGIQGAGGGVARPPIIAALTEAIGDRDVGVGTGMLNMTGQLGAAAGIGILSALVDDGSSADRFLAVLAIAAAIEIVAVRWSVRSASRPSSRRARPRPRRRRRTRQSSISTGVLVISSCRSPGRSCGRADRP